MMNFQVDSPYAAASAAATAAAFPTAFPAFAAQAQTQLAFYSNIFGKMLEAVQKVSTLNMQVAKTVFEESIEGTRELAALKTPAEVVEHFTSRSEPTMEKVRAYQQHIQNIIAQTQSDVKHDVETYGPAAARATQAVVAEVVQSVADETVKVTQKQADAREAATASIVESLERVTKAGPVTPV